MRLTLPQNGDDLTTDHLQINLALVDVPSLWQDRELEGRVGSRGCNIFMAGGLETVATNDTGTALSFPQKSWQFTDNQVKECVESH